MRTLKQLIEYCEEHDIFVPGNPTKDYLHAAIVRAARHEGKVSTVETCYGLWEYENSECMLCGLNKKCFEVSIGIPKEQFFRKLKRAGKVRLKGKMR